jgi:hypothetical protein
VDLVGVLVVAVLLAILAAAALRGRTSASRRPGPELYFGYGLSLMCILVTVISVGIAVHSVADLVGPSPGFSGLGAVSNCVVTHPSSNEQFSQCSLPLSSSSSANLTRPLSVYPSTSAGSASTGVVLGVIGSEQTNHEISVAVAAGLFALVAAGGWLLVWPRARRADARATDDVGATATFSPLGNAYRYLVAGLAGITLLVIVPVTADSVFRAIAPGVNQTSGHAPGVRDLVTFAALSLLLGAVLVYHLRVAPYRPAVTDPEVDPGPLTEP